MTEETKARCIDICSRFASGEFSSANWKISLGHNDVPESRLLSFPDGFSLLTIDSDEGHGWNYLMHVITPQGEVAIASGYEPQNEDYPFEWEELQ